MTYVDAGQAKRALHRRYYDEGRADGLAARERRRKHRVYRQGYADGAEARTDAAYRGFGS